MASVGPTADTRHENSRITPKFVSPKGICFPAATHRIQTSCQFSCVQVPQVGTYTELSADNDGQASDLMSAVNSIPAYVERSSHFLAVVPTVRFVISTVEAQSRRLYIITSRWSWFFVSP